MRRLLLVLIVLFLTGCGYHLAGETQHLPGGLSVLQIVMFNNQTMEPYLENIVTTQVTRRLMLLPEIRLVENPQEADGVVSGKILSYHVEASAYDAENLMTQYRATMKLEVELRRNADGRILWRGILTRFQSFSADPDLKRQDDLERMAQDLLSIRLAEDLSSRLTETF
jgi:outer membrane lipopolysaccharide assembly protein LptE/RlpB